MRKAMNILFFIFSCFLIAPMFLSLSDLVTAEKNTAKTNVKVGVVVDYDRPVGRMGLRSIEMAISEFYESHRHYKTRIKLHTRDSKSDVIGAASAALDLIKNAQVQAIIGPLTSTQANFVVDVGEKGNVPIVSFSATSPSLSLRSSYFFRATQNEAFQAKAIASIVKAFNWKQVVPIYSDDAYGSGLIPFLAGAMLEANGARVPYRCLLPPSASGETLREELRNLTTMEARVFVVHTNASLGARVFAAARELGMMSEGYVWIATNVMTNLFGTSEDVSSSMDGVLGLKSHVPRTKEVEGFRGRYRKRRYRDELNVFGLWAYDAANALALAVEEVWNSNTNSNVKLGFTKDQHGMRNYKTDLDAIGVSQSGPRLRQALSNVRFKGLLGNFSFVKGELKASTYEIVNVVNGDPNNVVGFWTPENGLIRNLSYHSDEKSASNDSLGQITWPGDSHKAPKGWEIPTRGKKLQVGVPARGGFKEFVNVEYNPDNITYNVTGYCIDIFEAVIKELPYTIEYDFIPFVNSSRESAGTYDDLVYQVHLGVYDAVVGDVTIRADRAMYVDFTLPYTESGVSMIVPVKEEKDKNAWAFMKPLTWGLWVTSACFFVFIGFVVWVLEHRTNEEFRGPVSHQIGTSFWFSFSTMVFAHREKVRNNLARFVIIVWVFVVLILTQSYTASLSSRLTFQQLNPVITNVTQLIRRGYNVGYLEASFVYGLLKSLGFSDSQLRVYKSIDELREAFSNFTIARDGIAAAFDENPYMNLFLRKFCSKYTMIDPTFKTDGFAFVFPRGSPLVPDVSRAILKVTEGDTLKAIEKKWFDERRTCPDPEAQGSSNRLGLESFWGLFLIAGASSLLALAIHVVTFFHKHWHIIKSSTPPKASIGDRFRIAFKVFDQKDLSSHTFKESDNVNRVAPIEPMRDEQETPTIEDGRDQNTQTIITGQIQNN